MRGYPKFLVVFLMQIPTVAMSTEASGGSNTLPVPCGLASDDIIAVLLTQK